MNNFGLLIALVSIGIADWILMLIIWIDLRPRKIKLADYNLAISDAIKYFDGMDAEAIDKEALLSQLEGLFWYE